MILFLPKLTFYKLDNFYFEIVPFFHVSMVLFLALHPMELIFLNSSDLLGYLDMLQTLTLVLNF